MSIRFLALILASGLACGHAWAAGGNSQTFIPAVPNGNCMSWPNCPAVPNDVTHPFYFAPSTGSSFAVTGSFWQATQPVSLSSIPLATNAAQESGGNLATIASNTTLHTGTITQTSVSCGTGSTTLLAASTATQYIGIKVPSTAANIVWINYNGAAAVTASPSEDLGVGQKVTWTSGPNGFLPTAQINCIASSATTVTLEYK